MRGTAARRPHARRAAAAASWALAALLAVAATPSGALAAIYSCIDASGKRLTSDRPIAECHNREQRLLNADGSTRRVVAPDLTADERAEAEAAERRAALARSAQQDAVRRDRNLVARFPNEAAHRRAREAALADLRKSVQASEQRIAALARDRKPLLEEAEFYKGRALPLTLKQALAANDAGVEAQRSLVQNQEAEAQRINALFDVELARLRRLWAGAPPGSMGASPGTATDAAHGITAAASQPRQPTARP